MKSTEELQSEILLISARVDDIDSNIKELLAESKQEREKAGLLLRELRKATGLSAATLNQMLGKTRGVTGQMEQGRASMDTIMRTMNDYIAAADYFHNYNEAEGK